MDMTPVDGVPVMEPGEKIGGKGTLTTSARKKVFMALILGGMVQSDAQEVAKVSESTAQRWMHDPEFRQELAQLQAERFAAVNRQLVEVASLAISVLKDVLTNPSAPLYTKVQSANAILTKLIDVNQALEVNQRLTELENRVKEEADYVGPD